MKKLFKNHKFTTFLKWVGTILILLALVVFPFAGILVTLVSNK
jgi:hypothetical protein